MTVQSDLDIGDQDTSGKMLPYLPEMLYMRNALHAEDALSMQFDLDIGDQDTSGKTLPHLREMTFNMTTGEASSRRVADTICDFPRVPLDLVGESQSVPLYYFHAHQGWHKHISQVRSKLWL